MFVRKPPQREYVFPGTPGASEANANVLQRSAGTSRIASPPLRSKRSNASRSVTPPGNRQPAPMMAMASPGTGCLEFTVVSLLKRDRMGFRQTGRNVERCAFASDIYSYALHRLGILKPAS